MVHSGKCVLLFKFKSIFSMLKINHIIIMKRIYIRTKIVSNERESLVELICCLLTTDQTNKQIWPLCVFSRSLSPAMSCAADETFAPYCISQPVPPSTGKCLVSSPFRLGWRGGRHRVGSSVVERAAAVCHIEVCDVHYPLGLRCDPESALNFLQNSQSKSLQVRVNFDTFWPHEGTFLGSRGTLNESRAHFKEHQILKVDSCNFFNESEKVRKVPIF